MKKKIYLQEVLGFHALSYATIAFSWSLVLTACDTKRSTDNDTDGAAVTTQAPTAVGLDLLADSLTSPVTLAEVPDNSGRLFIVDQVGVIKVLTKDGQLLPEPFLNLKDKIVPLKDEHEERGLLGLAFHPDYGSNGRFFVYYSAPLRNEAPNGWDHTSHVSEFRVSPDNPNAADPATERTLMFIDQPQDNHNAGTLAFGPDGYLYISLGDGGGADDTDKGHVPDWYGRNEGGNGQDTGRNLLGSILRVDINQKASYGIPADNPFVGKEGMDEIFAYGLRNPYRFSFDMEGNNELFAGDAGQELWEEVDIITKGGNYGWNVKEATHCFNANNHEQPLDNCPDTDSLGNPLIDPVIELKTGGSEDGGQGLVIIGGYVYRGQNIPGFGGRYLFGVWTQKHEEPRGAVFVADRKETGLWNFEELEIDGGDTAGLSHFLLGFGQSKDGEVYLLTNDKTGPIGETGKVYRLVAATTKESTSENR